MFSLKTILSEEYLEEAIFERNYYLESGKIISRVWVEKILQREGKTSISMDTLAGKLDFSSANEMFMTAGKDELSTRAIELILRPTDFIDKTSTESELVQLKNKVAKNCLCLSVNNVIIVLIKDRMSHILYSGSFLSLGFSY